MRPKFRSALPYLMLFFVFSLVAGTYADEREKREDPFSDKGLVGMPVEYVQGAIDALKSIDEDFLAVMRIIEQIGASDNAKQLSDVKKGHKDFLGKIKTLEKIKLECGIRIICGVPEKTAEWISDAPRSVEIVREQRKIWERIFDAYEARTKT